MPRKIEISAHEPPDDTSTGAMSWKRVVVPLLMSRISVQLSGSITSPNGRKASAVSGTARRGEGSCGSPENRVEAQAAIRSTSPQAVRNSVSSSFETRLSKARGCRASSGRARDDEGKAEARLIARVEVGEAGEFVGRQAVEAGGRLLGRGVGVRSAASARRPADRDGRAGRRAAPPGWHAGTGRQARRPVLRGVVGGPEAAVEGALGDEARMLVDAAEHFEEHGPLQAVRADRLAVGEAGAPVAGDVGARGDPDVGLGADVIEEACERGRAAGRPTRRQWRPMFSILAAPASPSA